MAVNKVQDRPAQRRRQSEAAGYRKGDESRLRILEVALDEFGRHGFQVATTRKIAQRAQVTLPALQYYFGGKEGLYRACGEEVVRRFAALTAPAAAAAGEALTRGASPGALRTALKQLLAAVARAMIATGELGQWQAFVARELVDPGPAFGVMLEQLWVPGLELVSAMVARIAGRERPVEEDRIQAVLLIGSLSALQTGRNVVLQAFRWDDLGERELAAIDAAIARQVDRL